MEHLDLAGYLGHAPQSWNTLGTFQEQDAVYLSSSRQMLEPILEETSEDEERARSSFIVSPDHRSTLWSSTESETGSVLRIETIKDVDAVSERDFVCPPKRPRRSHDLNSGQIPEDCVQLRRPMSYDPEYHNSFERFLALEACARDSFGSQGQRSSIGSRRGGTFEDFYSDRDSSHSLSRSSSLVQFESLERQLTLQEQHQSMNSLGNSSPSLTCESGAATRSRTRDSSPDSRKGSAPTLSLLKRYESSDCSRLHQTYYELNNLNFEYKQQQELLSRSLRETKLKSEGSSSSSSSSDSSGHSLLSSCLVSDGAVATEGGKQDGVSSRRIPPNSAENLSEDSGYCEPRTLKREKSKSIPKNFDKLCEEEEELLLLRRAPRILADFKDEHDLFPRRGPSSESESASPLPSPTGSASTSSAASFTWLHNSLPDIREPRGPLSVGINNSKPKTNGSVLATTRKNSGSTRSSSSADSCDGLSLLGPTHSLNELQVLERRRRPRQIRPSQRNSQSNSSSEELEELDNFFVACHTPPRIRRSFSWNERARKVVGVASAGYLNASYQNLTLLNYTDNWLPAELLQKNHKRSPAEEMSKQSSKTCGNYEHMICKGNFLLDEISKVYDKNVSILTDKPVLDTKLSAPEECDLNAPIECSKVQHVQLNIKPPPRQKRLTQQPPAAMTFNGLVKTFDQDPTNLRTSYTQSLERCHLDEQETAKPASYPPSVISQRFLPKRRFQSQTSAAMQRSLVSSTPNLAASDDGQPESEYDIYVSSAHASMHQLPQTTTLPKPLGILLPAGSRHSFGKEVSFCPVVSKYCWQEQSSEEPTEDHFHSSEGEQGPPSDDEQMDPTLVHNTRENENIVALFEPEPEHHLREPAIAQKFTGFHTKALFSASAHAEKNSSCEESANVKNKANLATPDCRDQRTEAKTTLEPEPALSSTVSLKPCAVANSSCREETPSDVTEEPASATARPLSLPILSEPPTNRAHHILYSSQQLRRYEPKASPINKMPPAQELSGQAAAVVRTDEKHPTSRSLFSRFTHGLRFSLRRKKKQQPQEPSQLAATGTAGQDLNSAKGDWQAATAQDATTKCILTHAPQETTGETVSCHRTEALPSVEREHCNQLTGQLMDKVQATRMRDTGLSSQTVVAQEKHTVNRLTGHGNSTRPTVVTAVPVSVAPVEEVDKMGLIETNLDTHETVISGKTRSLMDITYNPLSVPHKRYIVKRLNVNSVAYDVDDWTGG
ncbi:GM16159 [Drosophila sechellia]|uniref:GM16159 n=1 Tax=Drosophila sechellia TaxID=7238 RepID=B4IIJ3_DROSE|nr:GM16159 [Drosophila sechellia]